MHNPFTQKWAEEIDIEDLTPEQFLQIAIKTSKSLGWIFSCINNIGFVAYTNNGFFNWNAEVNVKVYGTKAIITSQSRNITGVEFRKDEMNIENFLATFRNIKKGLIAEESTPFMVGIQSNVA